ncbi:putative ABC transport system permease protein [Alteromonadaceae bacterium Bs31]|nr:putative ABC transport system permease protein [Alteromonadaceae bacterium Bs31]
MLGYYLILGWRSLWKTPIISVLMMLVLGLGMSFSLVLLTVMESSRYNPMQHKIDNLYAVQLDNWSDDPANIFFGSKNFIPTAISFRDAKALLASDIPTRATMLTASGAMLENPGNKEVAPQLHSGYLVTRDFFSMFDVAFASGGAWEKQNSYNGIHAIVLNEWLSNTLFGSVDSVGEMLLVDGTPYTVSGVVKGDWYMAPRVYDYSKNPFGSSPGFYFPLEDIALNDYKRWGGIYGWKQEEINSHQQFLASEALWVRPWLEFESSQQKELFETFVKAYVEQEQNNGRYEGSNKVVLSNSTQWMSIQEGYQAYADYVLAALILLICTTNSIALLMAKFLKTTADSAIRRALGASRYSIFTQHMFEAFLVALGGGVFSLLISYYWFAVINRTMSGWDYQFLSQFTKLSPVSLIFVFVLVLVATTLSGALPAWRVSKTEPGRYLNAE